MWGADGGVGKTVGVALPLGGKLVEIRRLGVFVSVTSQKGAVIFREDKNDVRPLFCNRRNGTNKEYDPQEVGDLFQAYREGF